MRIDGGERRANRVELMAPAGSWSSLSAALLAGADSVYFGVGELNMRSRSASNFSVEDLGEVVRRSREAGVKAYLTLNTILFDEELGGAKELCRRAKEEGVDAVIAADPGVLEVAREEGLPVHLSVQANVTNLSALSFFAGYADVVVLARELSLEQVRGMIRGIEERKIRGPGGELVRVEIFAHGALCVAFSGKCGMSLAMYGVKASASRGACYQPCRRNYRVTDVETGGELEIEGHQVMSPKDLCTLPFLDQILDAGVKVLKIEGRGRSADFVGTVVKAYRAGVDAWEAGRFREALEAEGWMGELRKVFHRGFWEGGYYLGKPLGEWTKSAHSQAEERKVFVGEITKYYGKIGVAEVAVRAEEVEVGDEFWVIGDRTGALRVKVEELRVGEAAVSQKKVEKGEFASFRVSEKVRVGDKVYRILNAPDC